MICLVLFSLSASFAGDNNTDVIASDDEVIDSENIAVSEDNDLLTADNVVTKDNFNEFFDESGSLRANVTSIELTFKNDI